MNENQFQGCKSHEKGNTNTDTLVKSNVQHFATIVTSRASLRTERGAPIGFLYNVTRLRDHRPWDATVETWGPASPGALAALGARRGPKGVGNSPAFGAEASPSFGSRFHQRGMMTLKSHELL